MVSFRLRASTILMNALLGQRDYSQFAYFVEVAKELFPELRDLDGGLYCPFCGRKFLKKWGLRNHLTRVTNRSWCAMTFAKMIDYTIDTVIHARKYIQNSSGSFQCTICGKKFMKFSKAVLHVIREHKVRP